MSEEKQCSKCLVFKPVEEFRKDRTYKDGLRGICKKCTRERDRKYDEANREKVRESDRKYYKANREKMCERQRKWKKANREKVRDYMRKYCDTKLNTKATQSLFRATSLDNLKRLQERLAELETR